MRRSSMPRRQHEEILAAQQRRHQEDLSKLIAELADVTKDRDRLRAERDQFKKDRDAHKSAADTARKQLAQHGDPLPQLPPDVRSLQAYVRKLEKQLDDATSMGDVGIPAREDWRRRPETAAGR
jgi:septal ring factor EnvC (AmiA/AmiB activator)